MLRQYGHVLMIDGSEGSARCDASYRSYLVRTVDSIK